MEDYEALIVKLKNEIKNRDKDIHLSATYGKQLLEENDKLKVKIDQIFSEKELLQQEKHSLQLEVEALTKSVQSLTIEAEFQRDRADSLSTNLETVQKENGIFTQKLKNIQKENEFMKDAQEHLNMKNKSLEDKVIALEATLKQFNDQTERSLCESRLVDDQELQTKLDTYIEKNKNLEEALTSTRCELEMSKKTENNLLKKINELEENIVDRDKEISGYTAEIRKTKEELCELQAEIEVLKFDQINTNKRGNSVFAELDDRRTVVEQEYKNLQKKYETFMLKYEENKKELDKTRSQVAILQMHASKEYQQTYIDKLETALSSAKKEICELTHKLHRNVKNVESDVVDQKFKKGDEYQYLRIMLIESRKREKELEQEMVNLRMQHMYENDKLIETQRLLYKSKQDIDAFQQEIAKLKLQMEEVSLNGVNNVPQLVKEKKKPNVEVIKGFKPVSMPSNTLKINNNAPSELYIPGELELFEDGFQQVKPSRKSNRFILQEFHQIKEDEGIDNCTDAKKENIETSKIIVRDSSNKGNCETSSSAAKQRPVSSTNRRYDNCNQQ